MDYYGDYYEEDYREIHSDFLSAGAFAVINTYANEGCIDNPMYNSFLSKYRSRKYDEISKQEYDSYITAAISAENNLTHRGLKEEAFFLRRLIYHADEDAGSLGEPALKELFEKYHSKAGCYIATCAYGSYDCPEVWTLRRFRDYKLKQSLFGRFFIRIYYATSPTMVKFFGNKMWFKSFCKYRLDKIVDKLVQEGYDNTSYDGN